MIVHLQPQLRQSQEDAAINNLLDIDLREQEDLNIWGERKIMVKGHNRTYSYKKRPPSSAKVDCRRDGLKSAGANFETDKKEKERGEMMSRSMQLSEREFWCSRVNWMEQPQQRAKTTFKPKLNKKFSFSYKVNGPKNSKTRYEQLEKIKRDEYKVNLIYSLLNHQDVKSPAKETERTRSHPNIKVASSNKSLLKKQEASTAGVSKKMEDYMRATLMRYYDKQDKDFNRSQRNPQQERGTIIRQMLTNLQNLKNQENPQVLASNEKGKSFTRLTVKKSLRKMQ